MTPLLQIHEWFQQADAEMKQDFSFLAAAYHPTADSNYLSESEEMIALFEAYLTENIASKREIVKRCFFLISLIEACLWEKDTEENWELVKNRSIAISEGIREEFPDSSHIDRFLETYEERKNKWIAWATQWRELLHGNLNYSRLYVYGLNI